MRVYVHIRFKIIGRICGPQSAIEDCITHASFEVKEGDNMDEIARAYVLKHWPGATDIEWIPDPIRNN
jgi:hypothetical protein